ncbi:MAG: J domain-containing protein [Alphaproteobacteria bacterium]|nr:J domain-containing protein [Alphaproteobacteria bacterium]
MAFALSAIMGAAPVRAENRVALKRTIIERLEEPPTLQSAATVAGSRRGYDYSVTRELLPPVDGAKMGTATAGWVTVVEARDLKTGSTAQPSSPVKLLFVFLLIAAGSIMLFWRQLPPRVVNALGGLSLPAKMIPQATIDHLIARTRSLADQAFVRFSPAAAEKPSLDEETENAGAQVGSLLTQIETVVSRLSDGSPLRDVLEQELRLIHYRISAATAAARNGNDTSEKSAARFRGLVRELERVRRIADSAAASVIDPRDQLALPQTRSEAYALLGVNPDVAPQVLKKLVDALRVTWHPDHARNESDRLLREERIRQINIAWDLIQADAVL